MVDPINEINEIKIPRKFVVGRGTYSGIEFINENAEHGHDYHFEFVKKYPHFYQYRCIETGTLESFNTTEFIRLKNKNGYGKLLRWGKNEDGNN